MWSLITGGEGGGAVLKQEGGRELMLYSYEKGDRKRFRPTIFSFCKSPSSLLMTSPFENFEDLVLLSPSEIRQELCEFVMDVHQGIQWYKVLVV